VSHATEQLGTFNPRSGILASAYTTLIAVTPVRFDRFFSC
jgi:hypothetical protein